MTPRPGPAFVWCSDPAVEWLPRRTHAYEAARFALARRLAAAALSGVVRRLVVAVALTVAATAGRLVSCI